MGKLQNGTWFLLVMILFLGCSDNMQKRHRTVCRFTDKSPVFDNAYHRTDWEKAKLIHLVNNNGEKAGKKPAWRSTVQCLWNDDYFYVIFLFEDFKIQKSSLRPGQNVWSDPHYEIAEVIISPTSSSNEYFEFNFNHEGAQSCFQVLWVSNKPSWNSNWFNKPILTSTGRLEKEKDEIQGWFVQAAIPWRIFRAKPEKGTSCLINFHRAEADLEFPFLSWSPTLIGFFHVPKKFGKIFFK